MLYLVAQGWDDPAQLQHPCFHLSSPHMGPPPPPSLLQLLISSVCFPAPLFHNNNCKFMPDASMHMSKVEISLLVYYFICSIWTMTSSVTDLMKFYCSNFPPNGSNVKVETLTRKFKLLSRDFIYKSSDKCHEKHQPCC